MSILVNGSPTKEFVMGKGLRQGDPLAPFLFLITAESLHTLMEEVVRVGLFECIYVGDNKVSVSHLQYADDAIFFGKWSLSNLKNLLKILECFQLMSGLKVNVSKSKIFGVGVNDDEVSGWARSMGCTAGSSSFTYLGLLVGVSMRRMEQWDPVLDKMKKKLASWKEKIYVVWRKANLSQSGIGKFTFVLFLLVSSPEWSASRVRKSEM